VNKLERRIRKQVVAHLSFPSNVVDVPYCLLMMSLVKDVERIGDYAKNLSEVLALHEEPFPEGEIIDELREIRREVETRFQSAAEIFRKSEKERALAQIRMGRDIAHRCEALLRKNARSAYDAGTTTAIVLGTRYYKRIDGHLNNILSSVIMPLHKIDYFDEEEIERQDSDG
ncbi:MAG: PhoU domain-containing protein, partial [Myxococcota bacterium]